MSAIFQILERSGAASALGILVLVMISALVPAGCNNLELQSRWRDRMVLIDGENSEWQEALTHLEDENVSVGILNDSTYLYVTILSTNRQLWGQIRRQGMTLWFDPAGGKEKVFGVHFPMGLSERGEMRGRTGQKEMSENRDFMREQFEEALTELEILGPVENTSAKSTVKDAEAQDIYVNLNAAQNGFVYELRIPLESGPEHPVAIGTKTGGLIGVRLETPEIDMSMMGERGREREGPPSGGMGRGMPPGGGPPGMGRPGGGPRREAPKALKVWAKVRLATAASAAQEQTESNAMSK